MKKYLYSSLIASQAIATNNVFANNYSFTNMLNNNIRIEVKQKGSKPMSGIVPAKETKVFSVPGGGCLETVSYQNQKTNKVERVRLNKKANCNNASFEIYADINESGDLKEGGRVNVVQSE